MRPLARILRALIDPLNVVKTVSMNILYRQMHHRILGELDMKIRDANIQNVKETKYLGFQSARHLAWKKPVETVSRKVSSAIGVKKHAKQLLLLLLLLLFK